MNITTRVALRWIARAGLVVWAAFWTWFAIAAGASDGAAALPHVAKIVGGVVTVALVAWRWPAVGGPLAVAAGAAAWTYFPHPGAQALLATPAIALGILAFFTRPHVPRPALA
ncbi:MAG: hypothetical protein AB7Q17_06955 [Phycisphaerae bacterium]